MDQLPSNIPNRPIPISTISIPEFPSKNLPKPKIVEMTESNKNNQGFTILSGLPHLKSYNDPTTDSGTPLTRNFCGECGSAVFSCTPLYPDIVGVAAGTLDKFEEWKPNVEQ
jgi:hypothetical protein